MNLFLHLNNNTFKRFYVECIYEATRRGTKSDYKQTPWHLGESFRFFLNKKLNSMLKITSNKWYKLQMNTFSIPYPHWKKILPLLSKISIVALQKIVPCHPYKFLLSLQETSKEFYLDFRSFSWFIVGRHIRQISANKCKSKKITLVISQ